MFTGVFTNLLLIGLASMLVVAAVIDFRTFTISNRLNLTVALLAPVYWLSIALSPWPGVAIQVGAGAFGGKGRKRCSSGSAYSETVTAAKLPLCFTRRHEEEQRTPRRDVVTPSWLNSFLRVFV